MMMDKLDNVLKSFDIKAECVSYEKIRNVSLYGLKLSPGTRVQSIKKFSEEIALALKVKDKLNFRTITENGIVQVEAIDDSPSKINLLDILKKQQSPKEYDLPMYLGNSINGIDVWTDLAKNPHILIAGSTGQGKSTLLHTIITNLLFLSQAKISIIDTKGIEFIDYCNVFNNIKIYTNYNSALQEIEGLVKEMNSRYDLLKNNKKFDFANLRPLVLVIDEFADLIVQDDDDRLYKLLCILTQKSRAAKIYCIVATQRPSVDIIRGVIKANLPSRIAFKVASKTDSRVILDQNGAELLVGNGDAIIQNYNHDLIRFQAAFTDPKEVINVARQ